MSVTPPIMSRAKRTHRVHRVLFHLEKPEMVDRETGKHIGDDRHAIDRTRAELLDENEPGEHRAAPTLASLLTAISQAPVKT